ncbi:MAG: MFS transporter, partial [Candidatus Latescibacteria bacterium]|nr:MFS transporter [Candidatus Latescibacterota bacterium]
LFKIIPTDRLGQLLGILFAVQFGGIALAGPAIAKVNSMFPEPTNYAVLFLLTFAISLCIMFLLLSIKEPEGEDLEGAPSFGTFIGQCLDVFKTDKPLRKFIIGKWIMSGHYVMLAFMIAFLISDRGFDKLNAGWFSALHGLGLFIGGFTITKIADKYGPKQMLITSQSIALFYTLLIWLVPSTSLIVAFSAFVITGIAQVSDNVGYSNMCMLCCPTLDKSKYVAVTNVGVNMLVVPLPIIFGLLMDKGILSFSNMFTIIVCMMVLAITYLIVVVENPKAFVDMKAGASQE